MSAKPITRWGQVAGWFLACLGWAALSASSTIAEAQQTRTIVPQTAESRAWAIVIGVDEWGPSTKPAYRTNDAELIMHTLHRVGYSPEQTLLMIRRVCERHLHPLRTNIKSQMEQLLRRVGEQDRLLIYLAGPAYQVAGESTSPYYFAPFNWDSQNPSESGVSTCWLRKQLEACAAKQTLLVLDLSAGTEEQGEVRGAKARQIAKELDQHPLPRVAIITSCREDEQPLMWEAVEQSVFGFWFNQAMVGHAAGNRTDVSRLRDQGLRYVRARHARDSGNKLYLRELYDFVFEAVAWTARSVFKSDQTPLHFDDRRLAGEQLIATPRTPTWNQALDALAEQLMELAVQHKISEFSVAEFRPIAAPCVLGMPPTPPILGGSLLAKQLEKRLRLQEDRVAPSIVVIPHEELHVALTRSGLSPQSFRESAPRSIQPGGDRLPTSAVVVGYFCVLTLAEDTSQNLLTLRCELSDSASNRTLSRLQVTARMTRAELEDLLEIDLNREQDDNGPPPAPEPENPYVPVERDRNNYRVFVCVDGQERETKRVGGRVFVPLRRGEVYRVIVENHSNQPVYLRLLVDGLNSLPEWVAIDEDAEGGKGEYRAAQPVDLNNARFWKVPPSETPDQPRRMVIRGFYRRIGDAVDGGRYAWDTFRVVDASRSLAFQQGYTEQVGLITAAFYRPTSESPEDGARTPTTDTPLGTTPGDTEEGVLTEFKPTRAGNRLHRVDLHYVEPEALEKLLEDMAADQQDATTPEDSGTVFFPVGF